MCGRENSIDILPDTIASYKISDNNRFKTLVVFDCRGIEPVDFSPRNGWKVTDLTCPGIGVHCHVEVRGWRETEDHDDDGGRETGTEFTDVDLTEKEWCEYDEKSGESTLISELEVKFVTVK